ncbi:hypothetical protein [Lacticaseibacillus camelliae]|nr:hypothetical protein [Lacticaseibacillus camelliae]
MLAFGTFIVPQLFFCFIALTFSQI